MIERRFVVTCDYCGKIIGTYGYDPTKDKDGIKGIATYDGHHFCNKQCLDYFTKDKQL